MHFAVTPVHTQPTAPRPGEAFLVRNGWDDPHFKTTFRLLCTKERGTVHDIEWAKIDQFHPVPLRVFSAHPQRVSRQGTRTSGTPVDRASHHRQASTRGSSRSHVPR